MVYVIGWLALPLLLLGAAVLYCTGGHFTYTLDDPYIHLALAQKIGQGHYGINLSEPSAPSSSVLWPLLMVPFSYLPLVAYELAPALINAGCLLWSLFIVQRLFVPGLGERRALLCALSLGLVMNLYGLVFNGLEHSLQVLLVVQIAAGLVEADRQGEGAWPQGAQFWLGLLALPWVRYEGLAVTVPVLAYVASQGLWRRALMVGGASLLGLAMFSIYLNDLGLGWVPSSIVAKSTGHGLQGVVANLKANLPKYGWLPCFVFGCACFLPGLTRKRAALLLAVSGLHLTFGHFGWFGRYEVYFLVFLAILLLDVVLPRWPKAWAFLLALPIALSTLLYATVLTPLAAENVYSQQVQMAKVVKLIGKPVAVNDLGLVSLRGQQYVLDLFGLGSLEALKLRGEHPDRSEWADELMARKGVDYALIYDGWFPNRPRGWIKVAELHVYMPNISLAGLDVALYAANMQAATEIAKVLRAMPGPEAGSRFGWQILTRPQP